MEMYVCGKKKVVLLIYLFLKRRRSCISTWLITWEKNVEMEEKIVYLFIYYYINLARI